MKFSSFFDVFKLCYFLHKICGYFPMTLDITKAGYLLYTTTLADNALFCASVIFFGIAARINSTGKIFLDSTDSRITQSGFVFARGFLYFDAFLRPILSWHDRKRTVKMLSNILLVDKKVRM